VDLTPLVSLWMPVVQKTHTLFDCITKFNTTTSLFIVHESKMPAHMSMNHFSGIYW